MLNRKKLYGIKQLKSNTSTMNDESDAMQVIIEINVSDKRKRGRLNRTGLDGI